jgi:hypothetical protein
MKKIINIFIVIMIVGTLFAGCGAKEEVKKETDGLIKPIVVKPIIVEDIIVEDIIVEDIIVEDIIQETVWVSPEYQEEIEYNSRTNEP